MFVPEYSITSEVLNNISAIEYGKALIESTTILPHWKDQLKKESKIKTIKNSLEVDGTVIETETIKKYVDEISDKTPQVIKNFDDALTKSKEIAQQNELDEDKLKQINNILTDGVDEITAQPKYRSTKTVIAVDPEQILAEIVKLFDWYNSLDAKQTHPILLAGILHGQLNKIQPFTNYNFSTATVAARVCLKTTNYFVKDYLAFEEFFNQNKKMYSDAIATIIDDDFTAWLEYYTGAIAREVSNQKEKMVLLEKDTKVAKASGRVKLSSRQEKIVTYLQDYGLLQNKDFEKLFPNISEDTVLRELKELIKKGIVVKKGKTKASRYELS